MNRCYAAVRSRARVPDSLAVFSCVGSAHVCGSAPRHDSLPVFRFVGSSASRYPPAVEQVPLAHVMGPRACSGNACAAGSLPKCCFTHGFVSLPLDKCILGTIHMLMQGSSKKGRVVVFFLTLSVLGLRYGPQKRGELIPIISSCSRPPRFRNRRAGDAGCPLPSDPCVPGAETPKEERGAHQT